MGRCYFDQAEVWFGFGVMGLGSGFHYFIPIAPTFTLDGKQ